MGKAKRAQRIWRLAGGHYLSNVFLCFFLVSFAAHAAEDPQVVPTAPQIVARAYLLMDHDSGRILVESGADDRLEPASLTKMMTAYVVFSELKQGNVSMQDNVTISEKAWRTGGSRTFVEVDKKVPLEILLKGVIIQSGNDASVALAEYVAGDESAFAGLMNQYAKRLGMTETNFTNSTGLPDPEHYSTARDLALLSSGLIRDFPEHYAMHAIKEFVYNDITQYNRNKLLWRDESVDGLKTGYTKAAGYCLVASAKRDDMRLISVVLGSKSGKTRASQSQTLLNFGFRFYETHRLYGANESMTNVRVWKGDIDTLGIGLEKDLFITVPRGQYKKLDAAMQVDEMIMAPVAKGEARGKVTVTLGEKNLIELPLVALQTVNEGGMFQRLMDNVMLMFH